MNGRPEKRSPKVGIVGDALAPYLNEAYANQMYLLSEELKAPVLTCNNLGILPLKKMDQYLIINARFLREEKRNPVLASINGAFFYPFVKFFQRKLDVVFVSAGINSGFLPHLDLKKCIPIINTLPFRSDDEPARIFATRFAPQMPAIVAQSRRIKERLISMGVDPQKVHLIYPWVDLGRFEYTEPPNVQEFRILFASAPNMENADESPFVGKGLPLLLESFAEFIKHHKASLHLLWRGQYNKALCIKIKELNLESQVKVIDRVVDTPPLYAKVHVTVIPFLTLTNSPEIPLSAVESLACGRPVVTTDVAEIAEVVEEYECGCVFRPTTEDLVSALEKCKIHYENYQTRCRQVGEDLFSLKNLKELIGLGARIYEPDSQAA